MATPQQQMNDRWTWKISIYSWSNIAASVALIHYKTYRIGLTMPMCKTAFDSRVNRAITMYYFKAADEAHAMWEVLKYVGKRWNHDSYLLRYDWQRAVLEKIDEQSHHHNERDE